MSTTTLFIFFTNYDTTKNTRGVLSNLPLRKGLDDTRFFSLVDLSPFFLLNVADFSHDVIGGAYMVAN